MPNDEHISSEGSCCLRMGRRKFLKSAQSGGIVLLGLSGAAADQEGLPCPQRVPLLNACVNVLGSGGLSNEKRDLDMLRKLGLHFGSTLKARELFRLIFERIPTTQAICGRENAAPSVWWDPCGERNRTQGQPD